ncbi:MAG: hypothetical protein U0W40_07605 [Acidimicrobiia bacterium]
MRVQELYKATLSPEEQDQADQENNEGATKAQDAAEAADVAPALNVFQQSPYAFGPLMLATVQAANGESAIDDLFRNLPTNDLSYVLPTSLLDDTEIATVAAPEADGKGEKQNGKADTFGSFALYLMLSQQLAPADALRIVDGWGGDAMIDYTTGTGDAKQQCVRAAFTGQTQDDTAAIRTGLEQWIAAQLAGSADVGDRDGKVVLSSCDVATPCALVHDAMYALVLAITRNQLLSSFLEQGAPKKVAQCAADGVVRDSTVQPILEQSAADPTAQPDDATISALRTWLQEIVTSCASTGEPGNTA